MLHNTHSLDGDFKECLEQFNTSACKAFAWIPPSLPLSQYIECVWSAVSGRSKMALSRRKVT